MCTVAKKYRGVPEPAVFIVPRVQDIPLLGAPPSCGTII